MTEIFCGFVQIPIPILNFFIIVSSNELFFLSLENLIKINVNEFDQSYASLSARRRQLDVIAWSWDV